MNLFDIAFEVFLYYKPKKYKYKLQPMSFTDVLSISFSIKQYEEQSSCGYSFLLKLTEPGIIIAAFNSDATGTFAPFNGMVLAGIYDVPSNTEKAVIILWEWESAIGNSGVAPLCGKNLR